jgi:FHA domain
VDLAATENPAIRAHYEAGSSRLVVHNNRMVFVDEPELGSILFPVVVSSASQRDFFMACVERWFGIPKRPDLVAVWVEIDHTAVLAVGRTCVTVSTTSDDGVVDPVGASFAAERVFRGSLRRITIGDSALNTTEPDCFVHSGVIAVSSVHLELGESFESSQGPTRVVAMEPKVEPEQIQRASEVERLQETPTAPIAPIAEATTTSTEAAVSDAEEVWDDTVWPARHPRVETVSPVTQNLVAASVPLAEQPKVEQPVVERPTSASERIVDLVVALPVDTDFDAGHTVIVNPVKHFPEGDVTMIVDWEPPAPVFSRPSASLDIGGAIDQAITGATTVMPEPFNQVGFVQSGPENEEPEFYDDMTIMAGDLERVRKSFVSIVSTGVAPIESNRILGAYCSNNHFTDSTQFACVFCGADTDFSRIETGLRPPLGLLLFDDGRTVSLTTPVVVGRKPSSTVISEHIAFEDDKMLSRIHTEFRLVDWNVFVVDRQSVNGTIVESDSKPVVSLRPNVEMKLAHGAVVRFGSHSCTFRKA